MVPFAFVVLDELPLTAHGKIDRNALQAPGAARLEVETTYEPPRSAVERVLADIWRQVLSVERVGLRDNFFDMGGHSLVAMQMVSRVREEFAIDLPIAAVFSAPTVAGLAESMHQNGANRDTLERTAEVILSTANLSDDELEALVASELAA
jgi:acyl carrier protein